MQLFASMSVQYAILFHKECWYDNNIIEILVIKASIKASNGYENGLTHNGLKEFVNM